MLFSFSKNHEKATVPPPYYKGLMNETFYYAENHHKYNTRNIWINIHTELNKTIQQKTLEDSEFYIVETVLNDYI